MMKVIYDRGVVRFLLFFLLVGLIGTLAGCGKNLSLFSSQPYWVGTEEKPVGFEVDETGKITVAGTPFKVYVKAGALGGLLKQYEVLYVQNDDTEAIPGDPGSRGSLAVRIPRGCAEDVPSCKDYKATFSEPFGGLSLSGQVAKAMYEAWLAGGATLNWRMKIQWTAEDDNGIQHQWVQEYSIVFPVR